MQETEGGPKEISPFNFLVRQRSKSTVPRQIVGAKRGIPDYLHVC